MLTWKRLPWRNLKGYGGRTAALMLFSALMAVAVFAGTMVIGGLQTGLETVRSRLGVDILVTPASAAQEFDAQTVLLKADPGYFYMDASVVEAIRGVEGVEAVSPQLFLASTKAGCCSARLQMIAFDPATDFALQPWIARTRGTGSLDTMDVIIGSDVSWGSAAAEDVIRFYDTDCRVVGQFAPTGSSLDSAVYMDFDTCRALIQACRDKGLFKYEDFDADRAVSSVMVRVLPGYDISEVAQAIRDGVGDVSVATSTGMVSGIADSLRHISGVTEALIAGVWALGVLMTVLIFTLTIEARRREFASLRAMGASSSLLTDLVVREAMAVDLLGGAVGVAASAVVLIAFHRLIGQTLGAGFVLPSPGRIALLALAALIPVSLAAALSAAIGARRINRMDASLVLKEGE